MSRARFPVVGRFTGGPLTAGTVIIEREVGLFGVRPHKRRRVYELPLNTVAEFVVWHVTKKELAEKRAAKKKTRRKVRKD